MAVNAQTQSFLDFLAGKTGDEHEASGREQFERRLALRASLSLMPEWARRLTGFHHADVVQRAVIDPYNALHGAAVRWAFPTLPARDLALARVAGHSEDRIAAA